MAFKYQAAAEDQGLTIVSLILKTLENGMESALEKIDEHDENFS
jgi:hypothetical protein